MGKHSKPWLSYKSDEPDKERAKFVPTKRKYKTALFWLFIGAWCGAHRFYLWDNKKAWILITLYNVVMTIGLIIFGKNLESDNPAIMIIFFLYWVLIILLEKPKLKKRVVFKNEKHLLL